ncbi:uncharacterized protein Tco025E_01459 [Trypanosoma conorhini]|uniref:SPRY domain-containing protein n=1 Tax=Trypanosoma conorhini TaxID=83891 RepID=A0A422Q8E2_9TRYP|nr:uncharacterized protein Tco025E_01459 [Trypanosoma conorhini]RNF26243.1 hypothetical protein Tco025E_01459 [Trypanosoma conorhini]
MKKVMPASVDSPTMTSRRGGGGGEGGIGAGVGAAVSDSVPAPRAALGATPPDTAPAGTPHDVGDYRRGASPTGAGARSRSVVRRICTEEEAARRSRICLQQLESWKNLRVQAWRERVKLLRPEERPASLRSLSVPTRDGREQSSCPPSPTDSPPAPGAVCDLAQGPPPTSEARGPGGSHLEKFYEGEVVRAATRGVRQEELERQAQAAAERRRAEEAQKRHEREAEARRRMEEAEALRQQEREAQRQLRAEALRRAEAEEHARLAAGRAREAAEELQRLQRAYDGVRAANTDAVEGLQLREQQVEVLSADVQRLTDANAALQRRHSSERQRQQQRIEELEQEVAAVRQAETAASSWLQELQRELAEVRRSNEEKERALREANALLQQLQRTTGESERQLQAAARAAEEDCRRADALAVQRREAQEAAEALREELRRCRDEAAQSRMDQGARFEALVAANESAAAASLRQLQEDLATLRRSHDALLQERATERAAVEAASEAQRQEIRRLHVDLDEVRRSREADAAELAERRRDLQAEVLRNGEAERLLRKAEAAITTMAARLAEQQQERAEENVRCERLEAALRETTHQLQRANTAVGEQPLARGSWLQPEAAQQPRRDFSAGRVDASPDARLRALAAAVESAVEAMLSARDHALRRRRRAEEEPEQRLSSASPLADKDSSAGNRLLAAKCVVKLMEAVTLLEDVLRAAESAPARAASAAGSHANDNEPATRLQRQQQTLRLLLQEMQEAAVPGRRRVAAADVLLYDPLVEPLAEAVEERLGALLTPLQRGESPCARHLFGTAAVDAVLVKDDNVTAAASPPPRPPQPLVDAHTEAAAAAAAADMNATRRLCTNGSGGGATPRHTFGFLGGRLQVSNNGTRLQRLLLPGVVDNMTSSALGALDHRSFLAAQPPGVPPCFEYTIRAGMYCDGLLMGFADRYLQLEGFGSARNSLRHENCYYLHLGRGTLFCPAQGIVDMPYPAFQRAAPVTVAEGLPGSRGGGDAGAPAASAAAVRVGEEVSCSLDTVTQTIRFRRDGVDCGVAFARVSLTRALFPAFEVNSRGCTMEFV